MYRTDTGCPAEYICPITQEVMSDPVMISETGQVQAGLPYLTHATSANAFYPS